MTTYTQTGGMPRSSLRHRPVSQEPAINPVTPRSTAHPSRILPRYRHLQDEKLIDTLTRSQQAPDTDQDNEIAPSTRNGYQPVHYQPQGSRWHPRNWHSAVWVCVTLLVVLLAYWVSTSGLAWWNNSFVNPGRYGPTQGEIVTGVFGGGDSQSQPSKLIAMNNNGHVQILMLHANDPNKSQILVGPDLVVANFPDPAHAHVDLVVGDFDHNGNQDVQVTIVSTTYDKPLFPYEQQYTLYGDGQGNLKQRQQ